MLILHGFFIFCSLIFCIAAWSMLQRRAKNAATRQKFWLTMVQFCRKQNSTARLTYVFSRDSCNAAQNLTRCSGAARLIAL